MRTAMAAAAAAADWAGDDSEREAGGWVDQVFLGPAAGPPWTRWMVSTSVREVTAGWPSRPLLAGGSGSCPLTALDSSPWVTAPALYLPLPVVHPTEQLCLMESPGLPWNPRRWP